MPILKSAIRTLFPDKHWEFLSWLRRRFGVGTALRGYVSVFSHQGLGVVPDPTSRGTVLIRPGTSDLSVYDQVFLTKQYEFPGLEPRYILDAGANIGLTSVYFATKYPQATIVSLEPEDGNYEMLVKNTAKFPNVRPVKAGLWSRSTNLELEDANAPSWAFRFREVEEGRGVPALGIRELMEQFQLPRIDICKIDIEGSEIEVLSGNIDWLDSVRTLVIELHDRIRPGCSAALEQALRRHRFERVRQGDNELISNLQPI